MGRATLLLLVAILLSGAAAGGERVALISGDRVHFRGGPGTRFPVLGKLRKEQLVVVVGSEGRWKKVRIPGGFVCFVHQSLIREEKDGMAVVTADRVLLRASPGKEDPPLPTKMSRGDRVTVLEEVREWRRIIPPDRAVVYVYEDFVEDLGPPEEYRSALLKAAEARRKMLLGDRPAKAAREAERERREARRRAVVALGKDILAGKGDPAEQERRLTRIVLESDDDLTRGYANALLGLVRLRREADRLARRLAAADKEHTEELEALRSRAAAARKKYDEALKKAEILKTRRENPFRGVGTVEKREKGFVLVRAGRVIYRLDSKRFSLADYVGKRVGVNGRLIVTDVDEGSTTLMVEKLEILPGKASSERGR